MTYTITIDQTFAEENEMTLTQASILSSFFELQKWTKTIVIDGVVWFYYSDKKMAEDYPLIFSSPYQVYRGAVALNKLGLVELTKIGNSKYIRFTGKVKSWNREKLNKNVQSEQNCLSQTKMLEEINKNVQIVEQKCSNSYNYNINNNINNNKETISEDIEKKEKKFIPPTLEDVQAYILAKGYNVDAERFIAYYTSNGWMVGRNKMKDWKSAVVTWQKSAKQYNTTTTGYSDRKHSHATDDLSNMNYDKF